jgi:hypothetical protein
MIRTGAKLSRKPWRYQTNNISFRFLRNRSPCTCNNSHSLCQVTYCANFVLIRSVPSWSRNVSMCSKMKTWSLWLPCSIRLSCPTNVVRKSVRTSMGAWWWTRLLISTPNKSRISNWYYHSLIIDWWTHTGHHQDLIVSLSSSILEFHRAVDPSQRATSA